MASIKVIVFDLDGVLLESAGIKTEAFGELFSGFPQHTEAIIRYHLAHEGISRYHKFRHIYNEMLKRPYLPADEMELGNRFNALIIDKILRCPFVPGAVASLEHFSSSRPLYIASGTPDEELIMIVKRRGFDHFFKEILGSSRGKPFWIDHILRQEKISPQELLFVGDALSDYTAAKDTGVNFVGRRKEAGNCLFPPEHTLAVINNLQSLPSVVQRLESSCYS